MMQLRIVGSQSSRYRPPPLSARAVLERQSLDHRAVVTATIADESSACVLAVNDGGCSAAAADDADAVIGQCDDAVAVARIRAWHDEDRVAVTGRIDRILTCCRSRRQDRRARRRRQ